MKQALLIIDAQQELIDGNEQESAVFHKDQLLTNINIAIQKAIQSNALIIFVRDTDVASGIGKGFQIHEEIKIPPVVQIIDKQATNSFYNTSLHTILKENEIGHLVIGGCKTEHCIDTAVRTATVQGFDVTLIKNGHSTTDSTILSAKQIIEHHNKTLHGHYNVDHFSMVRDVEEDLFSPIHNQYRE
ncbi:cysteine hydrolase [Bacillus cereus]|uniref:Cysteine hydrolase n=1 Tax=Bacillus cereus TaxID=1396 RepID=A0AA44TGH1_BACCE|nr:cysteine hydrolase family protein [Bacillus cereus]PFA25120.1 cysteine hydrolase [Bacillus cereus]PFN06280.1 cysteine hydrolase [Bacillus cereus]PFO83172.1 cysteine hydrolase [Bacillus cereus]PFR33159.1 cysteine hydrolase [Bacillus cereus]PFS07696.1 cysteine hydrolase [Bacillus cereus]